jgi:hypothetical protein
MLNRSRERKPDTSQDVPRTGYSFDQIMHRPALRIELDNKALLPLFDMHGSRGIPKPEARCGMRFYRDKRSRNDARDIVRDLHPSQVELLPRLKALAGDRKDLRSTPDLGPREVVRKTLGRNADRTIGQREKPWARNRRLLRACEEFLLF